MIKYFRQIQLGSYFTETLSRIWSWLSLHRRLRCEHQKYLILGVCWGFHLIHHIIVELDFGNLDGWNDWSKIPGKIIVI